MKTVKLKHTTNKNVVISKEHIFRFNIIMNYAKTIEIFQTFDLIMS